MGRFRILVFLTTLFAASHASAQYMHAGADIALHKQLSEGWSCRGDVAIGYDFLKSENMSVGTSVVFSYNLLGNAYISVAGVLSGARYRGLPNYDVFLSAIEALSWKMSFGLGFGFFFEQRSLLFMPSDYRIATSLASCFAQLERPIANTDFCYRAGVAVYMNIRGENPSYDILQRVRIMLGFNRRISDTMTLGIDYYYHYGNERQFYFADRHNMHKLVATLNVQL